MHVNPHNDVLVYRAHPLKWCWKSRPRVLRPLAERIFSLVSIRRNPARSCLNEERMCRTQGALDETSLSTCSLSAQMLLQGRRSNGRIVDRVGIPSLRDEGIALENMSVSFGREDAVPCENRPGAYAPAISSIVAGRIRAVVLVEIFRVDAIVGCLRPPCPRIGWFQTPG